MEEEILEIGLNKDEWFFLLQALASNQDPKVEEITKKIKDKYAEFISRDLLRPS